MSLRSRFALQTPLLESPLRGVRDLVSGHRSGPGVCVTVWGVPSVSLSRGETKVLVYTGSREAPGLRHPLAKGITDSVWTLVDPSLGLK